jgi:hypothetical protein
MRNGAYVRQKFEEATKSHGLEKWFVQLLCFLTSWLVMLLSIHAAASATSFS